MVITNIINILNKKTVKDKLNRFYFILIENKNYASAFSTGRTEI